MFSLPFVYSWKGSTPFHCFLVPGFTLTTSCPLLLLPSAQSQKKIFKSFSPGLFPHLLPSCCLFLLLSSEHPLCCEETPYLCFIHHSPSCPSFTTISFLAEDTTYSAVFSRSEVKASLLGGGVGDSAFSLLCAGWEWTDTELPPSPQLSQEIHVICPRYLPHPISIIPGWTSRTNPGTQ